MATISTSMFKKLLAIIFGAVTATSSAMAGEGLVEGGVYVTPQEDGSYVPLKILKLDEVGVHVRLYSNVYKNRPKAIEEYSLYIAGIDKKGSEPLGMGHLPLSRKAFAGWGAVFVQRSSVSAEELEGYRVWLEAKGGYF